jgi:hypothetical protein
MKITAIVATLGFSLALGAQGVLGQAHPIQTHAAQTARATHANADQLGMTCAEILQMSSSDWVAKFTGAKGSDAAATIRAINVYGKCYDARTDQLAARLTRSAKGPSASARQNFKNVEQAVKDFSAKALADSQPPADAVKSAYAALYEKQFRYEFYDGYAPKAAPARGPTVGAAKQPSTAATPSPAAANNAGAASGTAPGKDAKPPVNRPDPNANDADPVTMAKNHFGALLGELPDDQMHDLHRSFGEILGPNAATSRMQLLIYRYAIFLLEPSGGKPFAAAPF